VSAVKLRMILRRYLWVVASIVFFIVAASGVTVYILDHVRLRWPWDDIVEIEAEMSHGQAISPGQGQAVTISGVTVGQVGALRLEEGVAILRLDIEEDEAGPLYRNAELLMRPRTLGQDQVVELHPGSPDGSLPDRGRLSDGDRIGLGQTQVNVNPDEVMAMLDADTRAYVKVLLDTTPVGLRGRESDLRSALRLGEPTLEQIRRVSSTLAGRRAELRRLVSNLRRLSRAAAEKDTELASFVDASAAVFGTIGERDTELGAAVERLPTALASTRAALRDGGALAREAGPALDALRPAARQLGPALAAARPLMTEATPILRDDLRPLVREVTPLFALLEPPLRDLNRVNPSLVRTGHVLNYLANELGHNPQGSEEGYLFWLSWFAHNLSSTLSVEDANGAVIRGLLMGGCSSLARAAERAPILFPVLDAGVCP